MFIVSDICLVISAYCVLASTSVPCAIFGRVIQEISILIYFILFIFIFLLFRPKNAQYINNNVCIVKHSYMFRCIYISLRDCLLIILLIYYNVNIVNILCICWST